MFHKLVLLFVVSLSLQVQAKRIGIYTGTFDPPHLGHREVILGAIETADLDVVFVQPGPAHHKPKALSFDLRMTMTQWAFFDIAEVRFPPKKIWDLFMADRYDQAYLALEGMFPEDELFQVIGADRLQTYDEEKVTKKRYTYLLNSRQEADPVPEKFKKYLGSKIIQLPEPVIGVSSTEIRNAYKNMTTPPDMLPKVADFLRTIEAYTQNQNYRGCGALLLPKWHWPTD